MENTVMFESLRTFGVPCDIVDKYLTAPDVELRLILFLLRNSNGAYTKDDLETAVNADDERLKQAFDFWIRQGVLFYAAGKYTLERPKLTATDFMRYSSEFITERIQNDKNVKFLYEKAEMILAKPLTSVDASSILSLVDWNGLPVEVVVMLLQYCTENGKSLRQIERIGIEWSEKGIDTYELAEQFIQTERIKKQACNRIASQLGINNRALVEAEHKVFEKWAVDFHFEIDMIHLAFENTIKSIGKYSYQYMDKILSEWYKIGYKKPSDTEKNEPKAANVKTKKRYEPKVEMDTKEALDLSWEILENTIKEQSDE